MKNRSRKADPRAVEAALTAMAPLTAVDETSAPIRTEKIEGDELDLPFAEVEVRRS